MRKEFNIVKIKEQQETKKRINEFKLKQLKAKTQLEQEEEELNQREFDQRDLGQIIHGPQGMITRHNVR
jgi:hypothetical protein